MDDVIVGPKMTDTPEPIKPRLLITNCTYFQQGKIEGSITTERRFGTAENKSAHSTVGSNLKKLEESTEVFKHAVIDKSLSKAITATRLAKKMTQADLARLINERPQIIQEYESGKAIPNGAILSKLDKALGTHLPRGKK